MRKSTPLRHVWAEGRRSSEIRYGYETVVKQRWRCARCGIRAQMVVTTTMDPGGLIRTISDTDPTP